MLQPTNEPSLARLTTETNTAKMSPLDLSVRSVFADIKNHSRFDSYNIRQSECASSYHLLKFCDIDKSASSLWCALKDSNLRTHREQVYSLPQLTSLLNAQFEQADRFSDYICLFVSVAISALPSAHLLVDAQPRKLQYTITWVFLLCQVLF